MKWKDLTAACRPYPGSASMEEFFSNCPELIRNYLTLETLSPGTLIIETDAPCSTVFILLSGKLHAIEEKAGEMPYSFYDLVPFDIVGDYELFSGDTKNYVSVRAWETSVCLTLPAPFYLSWISTDSAALFFRTRLLMRQLSRQLKVSRSLLLMDHEMRCIHLICQEACSAPASEAVCSLKLNRELLATKTGCSLRTLHRILKGLEARSLLTLTGGRIQITKRQLEAMLGLLEPYGL